MRSSLLTVLLALTVGGCTTEGANDASVDGAAIDAAAIDAPAIDVDASDAPAIDMDASDTALDFAHDWDEEALCAVEPDGADCCTESRMPLPPRAASLLDLRELSSGAPGTCGDPEKRVLPGDPSAYPLRVLLPEITEADPACETACAGRGRSTAFGIVLVLPDGLTATHRPLVVAPEPWRYVYDHNSLAGDCCLDGYQEFGERVCVRPNYGGFIGFATGSTSTPSLGALIDLEEGENGAVDTCCPYLPDVP